MLKEHLQVSEYQRLYLREHFIGDEVKAEDAVRAVHSANFRAPEFRHSLFKLGEPSVLFAFKEGHQQCLLSTVLYSQSICATMRLPMTFRRRRPSPALAL
ncbi:hypothetical protein SUGI_0134220 [Cryptomeria japonica]|nr:hypothetical protein SUGI_0134220 [Cryptomeria japonica]